MLRDFERALNKFENETPCTLPEKIISKIEEYQNFLTSILEVKTCENITKHGLRKFKEIIFLRLHTLSFRYKHFEGSSDGYNFHVRVKELLS